MRKNALTLVLCLLSVPVFSQINISATAARDSICQGESVGLMVEGDALDTYAWSPEESITGANMANPTVNPSTTTTYTVVGSVLGDNLILNGDFSAGNSGFSTAYLYGPDSGGGPWGDLSSEGTYTVVSNPATSHTNFPNCVDHTTGNGNMLVVNGSSIPNIQVWCQTIMIEANTTYQFSSWVNTMELGSFAQLQFSINGVLLGNIFSAPNTTCSWEQFFEIWESGSNTTADICIVNQNIDVGGNDFGLDDISFAPVLIAEDSVTVYVSEVAGEIVVQTTTNCEGNLGSATVIASGGFEPYSYLWDSGETFAEAVLLDGGSHTVTITDAAGCTAEVSVEMETPPSPAIDSVAVIHTTCGLENGTLEVFPGTTGTAPFQYSIDRKNFQSSPVFEGVAAGTILITIEDANGCTGTSEVTVEASEGVDFEIFAVNGDTLCLNTELILDADVFDTYLWSTGETTSSITVAALEDYSLTVTDFNGCSGEAEISIKPCDRGWVIPNIFSPNGDGVNDLFMVFMEENAAEILTFKVYNRWGTLVHDDITPWDGEYEGKPHPSDVLIYVVQLNTLNGPVEETGSVSLVR